MNIMYSIEEVAEVFEVKSWEVQRLFENNLGRSYFMLTGAEIYMHVVNDKMEFVIFNDEDNEDCKKYMMEYERKEYEWKVYTDDIIGWEKCEVIDIKNTRMGIDRATVITESGTQLNRRVIFVTNKDDEEYKNDGCIYFWEKE